MFIKDSSFHKPEDQTKTPMIMVGPGTGVVPFIGFMQDREVLRANHPDIQFSESHLFFGCRHSSSDYIYKEEIAKQLNTNIISNVHIAFSREDPQRKVYVQDLMREQRDTIVKLIL